MRTGSVNVLGFRGAAQGGFFPERGVAAVLQSFAVDVPEFGGTAGAPIDTAARVLYQWSPTGARAGILFTAVDLARCDCVAQGAQASRGFGAAARDRRSAATRMVLACSLLALLRC